MIYMTLPQAHTGSYYAATVNEVTDYAPLRGAQIADVCVIGAGFTGISTALFLAERGYKVHVVEANRVSRSRMRILNATIVQSVMTGWHNTEPPRLYRRLHTLRGWSYESVRCGDVAAWELSAEIRITPLTVWLFAAAT